VALLRDDAVLNMPPRPSVVGAWPIGEFLATFLFDGGRRNRLVPTRANGSPAFVAYPITGAGAPSHSIAVLVLDIDRDRVRRINAYADPRILARFESLVDSAG
jgi:RNA polymerase sigma-70 factor (ECF subfamily)